MQTLGNNRGKAHTANYTMQQLALIVKVQANFRGFLARKKIRGMQYNAGMGGYNYEDGQ
mgnify:FL=1|jgi:hypothetical protein